LLFPVMMSAQSLMIEEKVKFLALGDSYTIGQSVEIKERWPVQLIDSLRKRGMDCYNASIIATTGWRTDNLKDGITNANAKLSNNYNLVSLLIGVNDFYQGKSVSSYAVGFKELLAKAIQLAGNNKAHVFVMSIPDYGYTPFGESNQETISKGIDEFNAVNKSIAQDFGVAYFNITEISRRGLQEPSLLAGDGLHPSGKMYAEWVDLILANATLVELQGENNDDTITGIKDERLGIRIHPNPFNSHFTVEHLPAEEKNIKIMLTDGKGVTCLANELIVYQGKTMIDTASLSPGIYHFQLLGKAGVLISGKLVKDVL
jgi:lysophospholipase L1-like esterase